MSKTIKSTLSIIQQKLKIVMLKTKIRKMERSSYLSLYERIELRDSITLLHSLEQQQVVHNTGIFSMQ